MSALCAAIRGIYCQDTMDFHFSKPRPVDNRPVMYDWPWRLEWHSGLISPSARHSKACVVDCAMHLL